jgi:hypothetical protein
MSRLPQTRRTFRGLGIVCVLAAVTFSFYPTFAAQVTQLPGTVSDRDFWGMVTELSEPGGQFAQQVMSNEDSAQWIIPALRETTQRGGVYIGVGSEQNFTYIAAIQPRIAFVVDIRRDNMLEHLMYKALFELCTDRADFVSRLFSRNRPAGLDANSSASALFDAYRDVAADSTLYERTLSAVFDRLVNVHAFPLDEADKISIGRILTAFRAASPHTLKGMGDATNPTYAELMTATDLTGRNQSYLASEENFGVVRELERKNLVIPVVGDFAGDKAIVGIGRYLRERNAAVNVFYVSNVERYLFEQGEHGRKFYANVGTLTLAPSSTFVRSVTSDISRRLGIPIPESPAKWRTFLFPIGDCLKAVAEGRIQGYRDLF